MPEIEPDRDGLNEFTSSLGAASPVFPSPIARSPLTLDNTAFYDFPFHEFLFEVSFGYVPPISDLGLAFLEGQPLDVALWQAHLGIFGSFEAAMRRSIQTYRRGAWDVDAVVGDLLADFYADHPAANMFYGVPARFLSSTVYLWRSCYTPGGHVATLEYFRRVVEIIADGYLRDRLYTSYPNFDGFWLDLERDWYNSWWSARVLRPFEVELERLKQQGAPADPHDEYPFELAPARSVNLGLRLMYRQEWKPLGTQPGEIVYTLSLAPSQTRKITTKIVRRTKRTSTLEQRAELESSRETTDTIKDSSEIINEATSSFKWNWEAEAHAGLDLGIVDFGASGSGGEEETRGATSKATSSHLSEAMRKTASRLRRETKVVVASESEQGFEQESFSEVTNSNAEIAVTYEYSTLQRQYEVYTRLAEIQAVIYIAEPLPPVTTIDEDWIRRHDWIIARGLRDESFRATLNELIQDVDTSAPILGEDRFGEMFDATRDMFGRFEPSLTSAEGGVSIPDIYATPQRTYQEQVREMRERRRARDLRDIRVGRLVEHVRGNALYYHQLIWLQEDAQQRILRYRKEDRRFPMEWRGPLSALTGPAIGIGELGSIFRPIGREAPVSELIDPSGPLGFVANYAVFAIRPPSMAREPIEQLTPDAIGEVTVGLNTLLSELRATFVDPRTGVLRDPARQWFAGEIRANVSLADVRRLPDSDLLDFVSYLPHLYDEIVDQATGNIIRAGGATVHVITEDEWAEYLYRKNNTRRLLVDTNSLYLNIVPSGGAALEPFKRAHRYVDVLRAYEGLVADREKNRRRAELVRDPGAFDPDIDKVVVVGSGAIAGQAAADEATGGGGRARSGSGSGTGPVPGPGGPA